MNKQRLLELAGVAGKEFNMLCEAAYDSMVNTLKQQFPDKALEIDNAIKSAKTILKKQDRMVWYIKVLKAYYSGSIKTVSGDYNFTTIEQFNNDLFHYYGFNINEIENTQLLNQNISEILTKFNEYKKEYNESDKAPVPIQHGDFELIKFPDGNVWWFVDRAFCKEEGRSGQHCGNVMGQENTDQRILSLRTANKNVILTFVLEPNGFLGEMKAKNNQKPSEKYHPKIMSLLLNPMIKGIQGAGFNSWMNFSVFDLSEQNIQVLIQHHKENLILTQIEAEPIEFLKAPEYIKNNPQYQQIALKKIPALKHIIGKETDLNAWQHAINENHELIIYAPRNFPDFNNNFSNTVAHNLRLLMKCNKEVINDIDLISQVISKNPRTIEYILPTNRNYLEYSKITLNTDATNLSSIDYEFRKSHPELRNIAIAKMIGYLEHDINDLPIAKIGNILNFNDIQKYIQTHPDLVIKLIDYLYDNMTRTKVEQNTNKLERIFQIEVIKQYLQQHSEITLKLIKRIPEDASHILPYDIWSEELALHLTDNFDDFEKIPSFMLDKYPNIFKKGMEKFPNKLMQYSYARYQQYLKDENIQESFQFFKELRILK